MRRLWNAIRYRFHLAEKILQKVKTLQARLDHILARLHALQETLGRIESRQSANLPSKCLCDHEFRVFSQWGEDGIIQHLLRHLDIENKIFVEFGVQNYTESNTRFLLLHNYWAGLIMDGDSENIAYIRKDPIYWNYNLKAECAFITRENINNLLLAHGVKGPIGLLSIDIDGNDYWVWDAIDVITPDIVIAEYNFRFGKEKALTIPYAPDFMRSSAHYSMIYFGASLKALCLLAERKGYVFLGSNAAGNNAFFLRRALLNEHFQVLTPEEGYRQGQFRESRDKNGQLADLSLEEELRILSELPLVTIE